MTYAVDPISVLSQRECWELLSGVRLGRLVTSVEGQTEIFPVNFVVHRRGVLIRTAEGTKLVSAVMNEKVLFEADHHDATEGWSVIVKGAARILRADEDLDAARRSGLRTWTAPAKDHFVWIRPLSMTGRRFLFGPLDDSDVPDVVGDRSPASR